MIKNCPVTTEDVEMAEATFGKSIACLKGKTARSKPKEVVNDLTKTPKEICSKREITLHVDTMHIDGLPFLTSIGCPICHRKCTALETTTHNEHCKASDEVLRLHNKAGFKVTTMH